MQLTKDSDHDLANAAIRSLSGLATTSDANKQNVQGALEPFLHDNDSARRSLAYSGLFHSDPKKYYPITAAALQSESGTVRLQLLYAFSQHPSPESVDLLEQFILKNEKESPNDSSLRKVAAQVIFKATGRRIPYKGLEFEQKMSSDPYDPGVIR